MRVLVTCCFLTCAFTISIYAQVEYTYQRLDINSGLESNSVFGIFQDSTGFIWIGSHAGIQRYDMNSFVRFSDSTNIVTSILKDTKGRMWVCGSQITILDPVKNETKHIPLLINDSEKHFTTWPNIYQDSKGRIWLRAGFPEMPRRTFLFLFNEGSQQFTFPDSSLLPKLDANILGVVEAPDKNLVLQTDKGLYYLSSSKKYHSAASADPGKPPFLQNRELSQIIHAIWSHGDNLFVLVWGNAGLFWIDKDMKVKSQINTVGEIRDFLIDDEETIWLAGERLRRINLEKGMDEYVNLPEDVKMINSIFQDRDGNIWLATYRGIVILDPHSRVIKKENQGVNRVLSKTETMALLRTSDGIVIASTWGQGLFYYNDKLEPIPGLNLDVKTVEKMKSIPIWSFKEDSQNDIWAGAQDGNLFWIDRSKNITHHFNDSIFKNQTIRSIEEDAFGNIWFGTQRGLIIQRLRNQNKFKRVHTPPADSHTITDLHADGNDIWAINGTELLKIDARRGVITEKFSSNEKSPIVFIGIVATATNEVLLCSSIGLVKFHKPTGKFKVYIPTSSGIASVERMDSLHYIIALGDGSIAEYHSGITILLDKGNLYTNLNSTLRLPDNNVLIPEEAGLIIVKPKSPLPQTIPAPTITSIRVLGKELRVDSILTSGLTLSPEENFMTVSYSALKFRDRDNISYYSRVDDERNFTNMGNQQSITFGRLSAGIYKFEIFYTTPYGGKSDVISFDVRVLPPFWREPWFIMLVNAFLLSLIYGIYWLRQNRTKALVKIREKISRDLHDEMGSNLSTINILSNVAQGEFRKPAPGIKVSEMLKKISNLSANALESVDQIVWSLNPLHDSFEEVIARMRSLGSQIMEDQGINFMFYLDGNPKSVDLDIGRKNDLFLIYKESINNISKYANCKNVYVSVSILKGSLKLVIADDGVGFNTAVSSNGNGLQNIKARSANLKGSLKIKSELNKGTRLEIDIPQ